MLKSSLIKSLVFSLLSILSLKLMTYIVNVLNFNFLIKIGTGYEIFNNPAFEYPILKDIRNLIFYVLCLLILHKFGYLFLYSDKFKYLTAILGITVAATTIVFQEYKGWDLNPYCQADPIDNVLNENFNIYETEYKGIKPGLSPIVWVSLNKICNFTIFGISYSSHFYWVFIFGVLFAIKQGLVSKYIDAFCLAFCFNLSFVHSIRSANYGFLLACLLAVFLIRENKKNSYINLFFIFFICALKIHYLIIVVIYFLFLNKHLQFLIRLFILNLIYYLFQLMVYQNSTINYFEILIDGYLLNELEIKAGIFNPVTIQFIQRIFENNLLSYSVLFLFTIFLFKLSKSKETKLISLSNLFSRNKTYDMNYFLLIINEKNINLIIFILCFVPIVFYTLGSIFGLGKFSELFHIISVVYLVFNLDKYEKNKYAIKK